MPANFGIYDSREDYTVGQSVAMSSLALSFRLLNPDYTGNCFIARRSSDNAEQTIGFSGNYADLATLESWAGSDTVYIKTWYDQSGKGNDVTQSSGASQPVLYTAGVMENINSSAAIYFNGSRHLFRDANFIEGVLYAFCAVNTCQDTATSRWFIGTNPGANNKGLQIGYNGANAFKIAQWNNDANFTPTWSTSTAYVWAGKKNNPTGSSLWRSNTFISTQTQPNATNIGSATNFYVGAGGSPSFLLGHMAEVVVWTYPISSSQLLVTSSDMKTYFGI